MNEWRKIRGLPAHVSRDGEVRILKVNLGGYIFRDLVRKPQVSGDGALYHTFRTDSGTKTARLHLIVARTFLTNPSGFRYVEHIDGDVTHNSADNLRWVVRPPRFGIVPPKRGIKLNEAKARKIRKRIAAGDLLADIAKTWGVSVSLISLIKSGRRWN